MGGALVAAASGVAAGEGRAVTVTAGSVTVSAEGALALLATPHQQRRCNEQPRHLPHVRHHATGDVGRTREVPYGQAAQVDGLDLTLVLLVRPRREPRQQLVAPPLLRQQVGEQRGL